MKKKKSDANVKWNASSKEMDLRADLYGLFTNSPIPADEVLSNLSLFLNRQNISQMLFVNEMYQNILGIHGVILEFGVRWGKNLALLECYRGLYEPYNHNRKIVGFDTFEGFPSVDKKDGDSDIIKVGSYNVTPGYEDYLTQILDYHEQESPISHIKKYELVKGDAGVETVNYLARHPETIVAMAYFDMDIYEPTKKCLEAIKPHLTKGSVIGFDQLNHKDYPGETLALKEVLGLGRYSIRHSRYSPTQSLIVID